MASNNMASGKPSGVVVGGAVHEITRGNRS